MPTFFRVGFLMMGFLLLVQPQAVLADSGESGRGYLWGGSEESNDGTINGNETGLGWISLNSLNCDPDEDGQSEGAAGCPTAGTSVADYGVQIPLTDGDLSGYAWSENVGWISFQSADLAGCPDAPCSARREGDTIRGWARILAIRDAGGNAGGYDGWIKLHSESGDPVSYGMTIDTVPSPDEINGYIWSDEFGWIDLYNVTINDTNSMIICPTSVILTIGGIFDLKAYHNPTGRIFSCNDIGEPGVTEVTADASTIWTSSDEAIFTVDNGANKGRVTGVATGGPINVNVQYLGSSTAGLVSVNGVTSACGNGTVDGGEECDDGAADNGSCGSGASCSSSCEVNICHCPVTAI